MGAIAGKKALGDNNIPDLIINASGVPKQAIPDTSIFFQKEMGFEEFHLLVFTQLVFLLLLLFILLDLSSVQIHIRRF